MGLSKFIIQRKIFIGLMVVLVLLTGSYAVFNLDKELFPDVKMDGAYVEVIAGETPAIEVERTITTPIEQELLGLEGVEEVQSSSSAGRSSFQLTFAQGKGDNLYKEVEAIANAAAAENATIQHIESGQYGTQQNYEFYMDISGGSMEEMSTFAQEVLEPRLESLPEVRDVLLSGLLENEISVEFNREKLTETGIDITQAVGAIQEAAGAATVGELSDEQNSPSLRWITSPENLQDIKNIQIPSQDGFIELNDIASVHLQPLENSSPVWKNGTKDLIFIQVGRAADTTQIDMAASVREEIESIRDEGLIVGFELNEMVAQADYIQSSLDGVTTNIIIGGVLAIIILLLFLRNLRATFIIGLAIPTSILLTFLAMWLLDYSFNILTLIGLGLGVGMMVDSSIVILESIYRKKEQGLANLEAVIEGTKEVATAVIASMLTTIVVFLPIGLLGGEMGELMIMLSVVVAITLISSVVISFTLIPSLAENFLKLKKSKTTSREGLIIRKYGSLVSWTVKKKRHSLAVASTFILLFAGSMFLITKIPMTIMPDMFNRYAELMVDMDAGLSIDDKETAVKEINEKLSDIQDVESNYIIDIGGTYYTIINMTKGDDVTKAQEDVNEEIFKSLRELQETQPISSVQSSVSAGGGSPVQVNIKGEEFAELQDISANFVKDLEGIEGIVGIASSIERTSNEQVVNLKEKEVEDAGLTPLEIKQFINQAFLHMPAGEVTFDGEDVPIKAGWNEETTTKSSLLALKIPTSEGEKKLSDFIELSSVDVPNEIFRVDGDRYVSISADIEGKDLGTINRDVQKVIEGFNAPSGYSVSVSGDLEQQQELMQEMLIILGLALFLVYFVMAVQFNHLAHPIIVMSVIPVTIIGVILGLFLTQRELSVMSGMGIVMLIGIVLNNAILFIDRTNQLRRQNYSVEEALVEAGKNRIRPIFMTSLTTVAGMLPLAIATGSSGNYQAPMATVIISGLLFATVVTLLLIPAVYRLFTTTSFRLLGHRKRHHENNETLETKSAG